MRTLFPVRCCAVSLTVAASLAALAGEKILVAPADGTAAGAARSIQGMGKVLEKDRDAAIFLVELQSSIDKTDALKRLRRRKDVEFAMDAAWRKPSMRNLTELENHTKYLKAKSELTEDGEDGLGIWESIEHFYKLRANKDGVVDQDAFAKAVEHRDAMPDARLPRAPGQLTPNANWEFVGPKNLGVPQNLFSGVPPVAGRITCTAYDPTNPNIIYAGAANGGVWKSTDGGVNWTAKADKWPYLYVSSIAVDPKNPNTIYAGTGDVRGQFILYTNGIMKSTDGGNTWTSYGKATFGNAAVTKILIYPSDSNIVLCTTAEHTFYGTGNQGGVYRSANGGVTWTLCNPPRSDYTDLDISIPNEGGAIRVYAIGGGVPSGFSRGPGEFWFSNSAGASWTKLSPPNQLSTSAYEMACSRAFTYISYVLDPTARRIYQFNHFGQVWTDVTNNFPNGTNNRNWAQSFYNFHISTSKITNAGVTSDAIYVGLITLAASFNGGASWTDLSDSFSDAGDGKMHCDEHGFANHPTDPNTSLLTNDDGLFRLQIDPATQAPTFTPLNANLGITQFYSIAVRNGDPGWVMGGAQDNGTAASLGNLNSWSAVTGGDGAFCEISPSDGWKQASSSQELHVSVTTNGWESNSTLARPEGVAKFIAPLAMSTDGLAIYGGTNFLYRHTFGDFNWSSKLGNKNFGTAIAAIATCPSDNNRIYVANRTLWVTGDAGGSWFQINTGSPGLPTSFDIPAVAPHPTNPADVLVGLSGTGTHHVFRCLDVNTGGRVWIDVSGSGATGLPDVPVFDIVRDPFDPANTWYAGTDAGVFMTTDAGSTWSNATNPLGLPNVTVMDLDLTSDNWMYAGTFGRGIWRIKLNNPGTQTLSSLVLNPTSVNSGQSFTGTVQLVNNAFFDGTTVALSDDTSAIGTPASAKVPYGTKSASFTCTTSRVTSQVIRRVMATLNGVTKTAYITLKPSVDVATLVLAKTWLVGGTATTGTVTLNGASPAGGTSVALTTNTSAITVPSTVSVTAGATSASFAVSTSAVTAKANRSIVATLNGISKTAFLTLYAAPKISTLAMNPSSIKGGSSSVGTVTMTSVMPPGGVVVALADNTSVINTPANVTVAAEAMTATFTVTTSAVTASATRQVTASYGGVTKSANLTLTP